MEKIIRLTLVGAALGLSVSSFATFVVQDYNAAQNASSSIFEQLYGAYLIFLCHYFGYMIRLVLVGNIKNYELFGRYFSRDNNRYLVTICLDYLSILISVGAAAFIFVPQKYVVFVSFASLVSGFAAGFDLQFRLQQKYRKRPVGRLLLNRMVICFLEFGIFLIVAGGYLNAWHSVWLYLIFLITDFVLCRSLFFKEYEKVYDELFSVEKSVDFYERIAPIYDRNIHEKVRQTQLGVVSIINNLFRSPPASRPLKILDLGGGTGEIAKYFATPTVEWTNVDPSQKMLDRFVSKSRPLNMRVSTYHQHADEFISTCQQKFDLVLATFVLTSLPTPPQWSSIARLLEPKGKLIVADINPLHTVRRPYFEVEEGEIIVAIKCKPVNFASLLNSEAAQLQLVRFQDAPDVGSDYAFIAVFEKPPPEGTSAPSSGRV